MMSTDMWRRADRRQFDRPTQKSSCARRLLRTDVIRIYELADQGYDTTQIAERVGIARGSVSYRLTTRRRRNKEKAHGKAV